jgi:uncharacterized membrane protein
MKILLLAIIISIVIFIGVQTILPFPYGLILGISIAAFIIWRAAKSDGLNRFSLLNYRRVDPKTDEELKQNKEAFRILKKRFLEGEISEEEFNRLKKDFDIKDE